MVAQMSIKTDVASYRRDIEKLAKLTGIGLKETMEEAVGVMSGQLAKRFPPKSKKFGGLAIKKDLTKISIPLPSAVLKDLARKTKDPRFDLQGDKLEALHQRRRTQKHNRTKAITTKSKTKVSNLVFSDKLYVEEKKWNAYAKRVAKDVGKLKSNWLDALNQFGGGKKPASWIAGKNKSTKNAKSFMKKNGNGHVEFINPSPEASDWQGINNFVLKSQNRMLKNRIRGEIKKAARLAGS